ncbi:hypothetical protein SEA_KNOCKER_84 [Mycobacterium phage Knocker]|nr:hypothetical protein SEA_KNOCKER_84 [Mycobacterium phage Knocker]
MGTFVVVVMDQTADSYTEISAHDDAATAQRAAVDMIADMHGEMDRACDTAEARAELDIDGDVVWAVWASNDTDGPILSLVAIVNVDGTGVGRHADPELDWYDAETVFVSMEVGTVYRIGGDTLAVFDQHHARAFAGRHRAAS